MFSMLWLENLKRILVGLLADDVERPVNDLLGYAALTVHHDIVDESRYQFGIVKRVRQNIPFGD